jgi:hypothetical protein
MYSVRLCPFSAHLAGTLVFLAAASTLMAAKTVYTTTSGGAPQNQNQFAVKGDAYIRNETAGTYYFEVTGPNGPLLSSDDASCRLFTVDNFGIITSASVVCPHTPGPNSNALQLLPYNDTPNNGGVYKVHVVPQSCVTAVNGAVITYVNGCEKSDNFKVATSCPGGVCSPLQSTISGVKYYDANQNGSKDAAEPTLANWQINVTLNPGGLVSSVTNGSGVWSVTADAGTLYTACEVIPGGTSWVQTGPLVGTPGTTGQCWTGAFDTADAGGLDFGNSIGISGKKYFDSAISSLVPNGHFDAGEPGIPGFHILVGFCDPVATPICTYSPATTLTTGVGGAWSISSPLPPNGTNTFQVCEVLPTGTYKQTGPLLGASNGGTAHAIAPGGGTSRCWLGTLSATTGANSLLDFGNICTGAGNALSKGWWTNKGNPSISDPALAFLTGLNLKNGSGLDFDPVAGATGRTAVANFLNNASATNMAYMLSAQMATMELDVFITPPGTNGNSVIYAPGSNSGLPLGYATLNAVMGEANTELAAHPLSLTGATWRSYQEALKTAFDNAANNLNFVQPGACPVIY